MKTKPLSKYKLNKIELGLEHWFSKASEQDIIQGKKWYKSANKLTTSIANEYSYNNEIVASVISALSPRNKWQRNITDAKNVLNAVHNGIHHDHIKVCTFNSNKLKAFDIAKGIKFIDESSRKTFSFVKNIARLDPDYVTIDVWHLRACSTFTNVPNYPNKTQYDQISKLTKSLAKKHNLKGYEYQAIIWCSIRK
jgi:hypothetical protein